MAIKALREQIKRIKNLGQGISELERKLTI